MVALVALTLPALSTAIIGFTVTSAAGATIFSATAAQLGLIGLGALGAKLALITGAIVAQALPKPQAAKSFKPTHYTYPTRYQNRGKREVSAAEEELKLNEVMDDLLVEIQVGKMEGCFERFFCDVAARPEEFPRNSFIVSGVELASEKTSKPQAKDVARKLLGATRYGKFLNQHTAFDATTFCEQVYNQCPWTGKQVDQVISQYEQLAATTQQ